ncbi:CBS domain-containing protein [Flavicella marina]|uniref:CBS domain-containing protein n=1 Tax=Flavicella marina TaxID=1475951 RepID=UPI0012642D33|nr:CBS domain-containing protein [Flavicella marina]
MDSNTPISKIMTTNVIALTLNNTLLDAEQLFKSYRIRHIPVVKDKDVIGILSLTDLQRISFVDMYKDEATEMEGSIYENMTVEQVMVKKPIQINSKKTIKQVAQILSKNEFHALPIVEDHELIGIVTTTDLLNYLVKQSN